MSLRRVTACGFIVFRGNQSSKFAEFLLMKHPNRFDLPKGHQDEGETDEQTALRELGEETGIGKEDIEVIPGFAYSEVYYPREKRFGGEMIEKKLIIYMCRLKEGDKKLSLTEHKGHLWHPWPVQGSIQANTIDPLLAKVKEFFSFHSQL